LNIGNGKEHIRYRRIKKEDRRIKRRKKKEKRDREYGKGDIKLRELLEVGWIEKDWSAP